MKFRRYPSLFLLPLFFVSPVLAYDQVKIGQLIPLVTKKASPSLIRTDLDGNLWVLDAKKQNIQLITREGRASISINASKSKTGLFRSVADFKFHKDGTLIVSDPAHKRVVILSPNPDKTDASRWKKPKLKTVIPVAGPAAVAVSRDDVIAVGNLKDSIINVFSIDGVLLHNLFATKEPIKEPVSMAFTKDGVLWVVDGNNGSVHRFSAKRKWLGHVKGMPAAKDITVDDYGYAYVSSMKGKWYEIGPKGKILGQFGAKGKNPGQLLKPYGLATMDGKTLYVSEQGNRRIQSFTILNSKKKTALLDEPVARIQIRKVAEWPSFVQDASFNSKGNILLFNLKKKKFELIDDQGKTLAKFYKKGKGMKGLSKPAGFDFDNKDQLWVSDMGDHSIKQVSETGDIVKSVGQKGRKEGSLKGPSMVKLRKDGSFIIVDKSQSRIQILGSDGLFMFRVGQKGKDKGQISEVTDLAVNDERIAVIDNSRKALLFFDFNGKFISEIANKEGKSPIWLELTGLDTDEKGRFFVLDSAAQRVRTFDRNAKFIADVYVSGMQLAAGPNGKILTRSKEKISIYAMDVVPKKIKGFSAKDDEGIIRIQWEACDSCVEYKVYKSTPFADYQLVMATSSLSLFDEAVRPGLPYTYAVRGVNQMEYEGNWTKAKPVKPTRRKDLSLVTINEVSFNPVFSAAFKSYIDEPIGTVTIQNNDDRPIRNIKVSLTLKDYTDFATEKQIKRLAPGEIKVIPVTVTFNKKILELTENTPVQVDVKTSYFENNEKKSVSRNAPLTLYSRNAIVWNNKQRISSFITPRDVPIVEFSRSAVKAFLPELKGATFGKQLAKAVLFYESLNALNMSYVPDPKTPFAEAAGNTEIIDYVQFPRETLRRKTGDCDDTTALLSSLLESIGVETALVDTPGHIFMMANLDESDPEIIGLPEDRFVEYRGTFWVPIETTKLGKSFEDAWNTALNQVNDAKEQGKVEFVPLVEASEKYAPVTLVEKESNPTPFVKEKVAPGFKKVMSKLQNERYQAQLKAIKTKIKTNPNDKMLEIKLGMVHVEGGKTSEGKKVFNSLVKSGQPEVQSSAHNNLGNLAFLSGDYANADKHYADASILSPDDGGILINRARTSVKLGRRKEAKKFLSQAKDLLADWREYTGGIPAGVIPKY